MKPIGKSNHKLNEKILHNNTYEKKKIITHKRVAHHILKQKNFDQSAKVKNI